MRKRKDFLPIAGLEPATFALGAKDLTTELWCYYTYALYTLAIYSYILNRQYYIHGHIFSTEEAMKLEQKPECS